MSSQPVEANVVLTADTSQYNQAIDTSTQSTNQLGTSIDSLGQKMNNLSKSAGKKLLGITAADVAGITAATAAYASYEKQISRLQAQAAILTKTEGAQTRTLADYTRAVNTLRSSYGTTTTEAAKLVEVLSKITNVRQSRGLTDLSKVFIDMSHATGESSEGLASSLTNLQRLMGTPINAETTRKYADQFTYLSAQTQTSAQGLIDFTTQLAPFGRSLGLNQKQITGFATAFAKAGQDGYVASNAFSKFTQDITNSLTTGSSEMSEYANIVGITANQFRDLAKDNPQEALLEVLEGLQRMGPRASVELQRLGLDGTKAMRSLSAVLNQPGGVREALGQAQAGFGSGAAGKGAEATDSISRSFDKMRETVKQTAEIMGSYFAPMVESFATGMNTMAKSIQNIVDGPLGQLMGMMMQFLAPLGAGAGALGLFAGGLLKIAGAFLLFRNSASRGVIEGFRGGAAMTRTGEGDAMRYIARGGEGSMLGPTGARLAAGGTPGIPREQQSTWMQRLLYNTGQPVGAGLSSIREGITSGYHAGRLFADPNYKPAGPRPTGVLSYMAGGASRFLEQFINPQFDQMRYEDETKRSKWLGQQSPLARFIDRQRLSGAMGDVGLAKEQMGKIGAEEERVRRDAFLTNAEREARMANLAGVKTETQARLAAAELIEQAAVKQVAATEAQTTAARTQAVGFKRLFTEGVGGPRGLVAGAGGAVLGGVRQAGGTLMRSDLAMPAVGMLGMTAAGAMGVQSNAINMGAMGLMMGSPMLGLAGFGVGSVLDAQQQVKNFNEMKKAREDALKTGTPSGIFSADQAAVAEFNRWQVESKPKGLMSAISGGVLTSDVLKHGFQEAYGRLTFQGSAYGQRQSEAEAAQAERNNLAGAIQEISEGRGKRLGTIDLKRAADQQKLDQVITELTPTMDKLGISVEDVTEAFANRDTKEGAKVWTKMIRDLVAPGRENGLWSRLRGDEGFGAGTEMGRALLSSRLGRRSITSRQGDLGTISLAIDDIYDKMRAQGMSNLQIMGDTERTIALTGGKGAEGERAAGVLAKVQQTIALGAPLQTRVGLFQQQVGAAMQAPMIRPGMPEDLIGQIKGTETTAVQGLGEQITYLKQMYMMQIQYEKSKRRAEEDYQLQVEYANYDFNLQRERQEEAFNRSRRIATADYYRTVRRAEYDFHLQRERALEDFAHQSELAGKQVATNMNIYERTPAQQTVSSTWMLANAQDQLKAMREQERNLNELRKLGFSDAVIQQLRFTDPNNAQQLARFVTEVRGDQSIVQDFNRTARQRQRAGQALATDESDAGFAERRYQLRTGFKRTREDFSRQLELGREDFFRQMRQQKKEFGIMQEDQLEDFKTGMNRQEKAYNTQMQRAATDIADAAREIDMSLTELLTKSQEKLTGHAKVQATQIATTLENLSTSTKPQAIRFMKDLAAIYGVDYTPPKVSGGGGGPSGPNATVAEYQHPGTSYHTGSTPPYYAGGSGGPSNGMPRALGGIIPGWTPGRDTQMVPLSGGEAIMRPEWARAVGKAAIDQMNHQARHGGYWLGGVMPLPNASVSSHGSTYPFPAYDLNYPGYADYGKPIIAWKGGIAKPFDYGRDYSYGRGQIIAGDGHWERYAHMSRVLTGLAGKRVSPGQVIGYVGDYGNTGTPPTSHLHFEIHGGKIDLGDTGTGGGGGAPRAHLRDLLKRFYPGPEHAAAMMNGVHPLHPGDISHILNRGARAAFRNFVQNYGRPGAGRRHGAGRGSEAVGPAPKNVSGNQALMRKAMLDMGWHQWDSLYNLEMGEAGFDNFAQNPTSTAFGMGQFLNSTWAGTGIAKTSDPWKQSVAMMRYIKSSYGDPDNAWRMWQSRSPHWYGDGAVFNGPHTIGVGERGPEAVIPLNDQGGEFLARSIGLTSTPVRGGLSVYNTRIDRSTNFNGGIVVQASDPMEMMHKLQARQRVMALSRPQVSGSAA